MLRPYLKIWEWELTFGCAVDAISSPGVHSQCARSLLFNILINVSNVSSNVMTAKSVLLKFPTTFSEPSLGFQIWGDGKRWPAYSEVPDRRACLLT